MQAFNHESRPPAGRAWAAARPLSGEIRACPSSRKGGLVRTRSALSDCSPAARREALSSTSATATSPGTSLSRQFRRQSSARAGSRSTKTKRASCSPFRHHQPDGAGRRAHIHHHVAGPHRSGGGQQHRIGAGAVTLGGLVQANAPAEQQILGDLRHDAIRLRALHRRSGGGPAPDDRAGTRIRRGKTPIMPSRAFICASATRTGILAFSRRDCRKPTRTRSLVRTISTIGLRSFPCGKRLPCSMESAMPVHIPTGHPGRQPGQ